MPGATAKDALEYTGTLASDGMRAFALAVVGVGEVASTALEAGDERGRLLAGAGGVADMMASAV